MAECLKVSIQGTLPNQEVWSVNPVFMLTTEPDPTWDQLNTLATAINARAIGLGLQSWMNANTAVTGVRLEARNRAGGLVNQIEQQRPSPVLGTGAYNLPQQTAAVVSLRSAYPGGQGRGRLYWPATGGKINGTTARWDSVEWGALGGYMKTYLSGIETDIQGVLGANDLVVWSRTGTAFHAVNRLLVGNVPDVQRRRRDQAVETYTSTVYP